jgi:hypothetical protein
MERCIGTQTSRAASRLGSPFALGRQVPVVSIEACLGNSSTEAGEGPRRILKAVGRRHSLSKASREQAYFEVS